MRFTKAFVSVCMRVHAHTHTRAHIQFVYTEHIMCLGSQTYTVTLNCLHLTTSWWVVSIKEEGRGETE